MAKIGHTYIFTHFEIIFSKKFKKYIFNNLEFIVRLYLLVIKQIYFIEKWDQVFWLLYTEIKKVQKRISYHIFLLSISTLVIKRT